MTRPEFKARSILMRGESQVELVRAALRNIPLDADNPLEVVIREQVKVRKMSQNDAMWAGALKDIAEQAWLSGRQYSAEVWHEYFKVKFLPDYNDPDIAELVKDPETWEKWDFDPDGNRICVGTTTRLTRKGFAIYTTQLEAFGANLGVQFHEAPRNDR